MRLKYRELSSNKNIIKVIIIIILKINSNYFDLPLSNKQPKKSEITWQELVSPYPSMIQWKVLAFRNLFPSLPL